MTTWIKIRGTGYDGYAEYKCSKCECEDGHPDCPLDYNTCCEKCGCECPPDTEGSFEEYLLACDVEQYDDDETSP